LAFLLLYSDFDFGDGVDFVVVSEIDYFGDEDFVAGGGNVLVALDERADERT